MPLKLLTEIFTPDPRLIGHALPTEVATVFDRAWNTKRFAFLEYELWVVGELQAFGAFEFAIKFRLASVGILSSGTLRKHIGRARKHGIIPQMPPRP